MKVINTGSTYRLFNEKDLLTFDKLPSLIYKVNYNRDNGFFLESTTDFNVEDTTKIYGDCLKKCDRVFNTFDNLENRNLGIILSGVKGSGKTLMAKQLCKKSTDRNIPVIVVDKYFPSISNFLSQISQEVLILFDEFEKTFVQSEGTYSGFSGEREERCVDLARDECYTCQDELLTLFDGISTSRKIFVIICNELTKLSRYFIDRPGRFHYHFKFKNPTISEVTDYLNDNIVDEYKSEIKDVIKISSRLALSYDSLRAICFEINQGNKLVDCLNYLNIGHEYSSYCKISVELDDGNIYTSQQWINTFSNESERLRCYCEETHAALDLKIVPRDFVYDIETDKFTVDLNKIIMSYEKECRDFREHLDGKKVTKVTLEILCREDGEFNDDSLLNFIL